MWYPFQFLYQQLALIVTNQGKIMSSFADLATAMAGVASEVAVIKADVDALLAKLAAVPPAGLTAEQQTALDAATAQATAVSASLAGIHAEVSPPAPAPAP